MNEKIFIQDYVGLMESGIMRDIGPYAYTLFKAITYHMDRNGYAFPSQRRLKELTGLNINTINKYVNELLEYRYEGKPIITREFQNGTQGKRSIYRITTPYQKFGKQTETKAEI